MREQHASGPDLDPVAIDHSGAASKAGGAHARVGLFGILHQAWTIWQYRDLIRVLAVRNVKVKYQRSALGLLWTLLNPLLMLLILMAVFTHIVRIPIPAYWAFLLSGYFVFHCVSQILHASSLVYLEHATMVRSIAFPIEAPVVAATLSRLFEFTIELGLTLILIVLFRHGGVPLSFVLIPWLFVLLLLLTLGLAMPVAALSVFYYDVRHMLPALLAALFYISPVFYSVELVPEALQPIYYVNPVAYLLTIFHIVLYEGRVPSLTLLAGATALMAATFLVGYALLNRSKHLFAEVV